MIVTMDRVQKEKEGSWHKTSLKRAAYFEKYTYNCIFTERFRLLQAKSNRRFEINVELIGIACGCFLHFFSFLKI